MKIQDSIALVTGANRGLGLAFAQALLARGARKVYAGARDPRSVNAVPGLIPIALDVNDSASIAAAAADCPDINLVVNNAGIARLLQGSLDPGLVDASREIFETNYYGVVRSSQAFAPLIARNGGGAVLNVLSDQSWFALPLLAAYSASKSAAWSFTNALRVDVRDKGIQVLGLHVGFLDTDMTKGADVKKSEPADVARQALDALEAGEEEVIADEGTRELKRSLSTNTPYYLRPASPF